jgi:DNA-binding MarR family transcriptional regulator
MLESADAGLTLPQYRVLCALCEGGQRSARLADKLAVRKPTLTALADGLIAAGYALRESEPGDRRIVRLCLTPAGKAALHRADTAYRARLSDLLADVPDPAAFVGGLLAVGGALDNAPDRRAAGKPAADRQTAADTQASDTETAADTQTEDERGTEKAVVHR